MVKIEKDFSLKEYNTFHLDVKARRFVQINSKSDVTEALQHPEIKNQPLLVIGRGANILFTQDYPGVVFHVNIKGKEILSEDDKSIFLKVGAGEDWPELVMWTVEQEWAGLENLADIPGQVGAAPIQNIAAYGAELADTFHSLEALNIKTMDVETFTKEDCKFKYRNSIFKEGLKKDYIILNVTFKLTRTSRLDTTFYDKGTSRDRVVRSVESELKKIAKPPYSAKDIALAVTAIRKIKLPQVDEVGTCGSTFANPFVTKDYLKKLLKRFPGFQYYPVEKMLYPKMDDPKLKDAQWVKVPAGWLIDELGWLGKRVGNVGVSPKHALCVVAYEGAKPQELLELTQQIKKDVQDEYGIELEYEVNVI